MRETISRIHPHGGSRWCGETEAAVRKKSVDDGERRATQTVAVENEEKYVDVDGVVCGADVEESDVCSVFFADVVADAVP